MKKRRICNEMYTGTRGGGEGPGPLSEESVIHRCRYHQMRNATNAASTTIGR